MSDAPAVGGSWQHDAWLRHVVPDTEQVRDGLWSIPVVIPNSPLRYVIVYAIEVDDGLALVDTGWPDEESWDALVAGIAATGHQVQDVRTVLITHGHTDHHGLTTRLVEASGASVGMHPAEAALFVERDAAEMDLATVNLTWLADRGVPREEIERLASQVRAMWVMGNRLPHPTYCVQDGDRALRSRPDIRAIWTPGHTAGHLCFSLERDRVLLTGDHVLPHITPNVARSPLAVDDAVGDYVKSLRRIALESASEVLPAHEYRFTALVRRVETTIAHHVNRLAEIEAVVSEHPGRSTWDVATAISWSRGWESTSRSLMMRQTAISETYAHLTHLERRSRLRRDRRAVDRWVPTRPAVLAV